ncbi:MAG: multiheme c-type cytochrome [Candidatus Binatia bacterium]
MMCDRTDRKEGRDDVAVVGPRLRWLLSLVLGLFAVLSANSLYLLVIRGLSWVMEASYEGPLYLWMFLVHLALGFVLVFPVFAFIIFHVRRAYSRSNRQAVRAGFVLLSVTSLLFLSGFLLFHYRVFNRQWPGIRAAAYWIHALSPLLAVWFFILHRLAGPPLRWKVGARWVAVSAAVVAIGLLAPFVGSAKKAAPSTEPQADRFAPSLAQTTAKGPIPAKFLMMDDYCRECHADIHASWSSSAHRLSSFNNPAYKFSVRETRRVLLARDGDVRASRFCAACHDPVPLFSGVFDNPDFDEHDPTAQAGITCVTCHAIGAIASPRGNGAYILDEPVHYPFTFSDSTTLRRLNRQLVKAKPDFHKKTFLKPLHRTAEFCSACHKVHIPAELNRYRWLRGQNHYDSFLLSGVSGHGASSFYYPPQASSNCQSCHMPLQASTDFGAKFSARVDALAVHDHLFPGANTALPRLLHLPEQILERQREFLTEAVRLDIFAVREDGHIGGALHAPLRPDVPTLQAGKTYLIDVVVRTLRLGHPFTQGTADSNEVWLAVTARAGERIIGQSGMRAADGTVDPWAHFINAYVLDREGRRIDRRNVQDIFVPLYDHQIPPGAADVVHYRLQIPEDLHEALVFEVQLLYRKFDTAFVRHFLGEAFTHNDLPITTIATDRVVFPIAGGASLATAPQGSTIPLWERWNDYGIGLLRKSGEGSNRGELRQAANAFAEVEQLGRADGPLNIARVFIQEGRLDEAADALRLAARMEPPAPPWVIAWLTGLVNQQTGHFDAAIANFQSILVMDTDETRRRGFDFSRDYRVLNELGLSVFEQAKRERQDPSTRTRLLQDAVQWFARTLVLDPENSAAHYNLSLIAAQLNDRDKAEQHARWHERYRIDENARERALSLARRNHPPANHAAEAVVVYDLR